MKKFCIYAICKNESKFISRWYNSIKDADYICILDTGSTDNTLELLADLQRQHPEQIIYSQKEIKPWRFDTARNESMKLIPADADILVSADIDDVFQPNWKIIIEKYINQGYNKIIGSYPYYDVNNNITYEGMQDRVCLNDGNSHWENGIHERLVTLNEKKVTTNEFIIEHRQDLTKPRRECYLEAAKNSLEPGNFYGQLCYGYELCNSGYTHDSIKTFIDLYNNLPKNSEYLTRKWINLLANMCGDIGNKQEKEHWLKIALTINNRKSPFEDYMLYNGEIERELNAMKNKICVYAICKNESKFVDTWYESMKEADAIVVLDTGSTDDTVDKLRAHGVKVEVKEIKPWRFDVARNESLKLVPDDCNILICTDLDEILRPGWAKVLREKWIDGKYQRATYKYIWSHLDNGAPGRVFGYNKIHTKDWEWRYPVHELLWHKTRHTENYSNEESLNLFNEITLEHFPDKTKSRSSYLGLLELREKDYPEDMYGLIYLAHEYRYRGFLEKSIEKLNKVLTVYDKVIGTIERASCYLFMGDNYRDLKKYNEAISCYLKGIEIEPTYRELYLNMARAFMDMKNYKVATEIIKQGLARSYRHYTWLERDTSWSYEPYDLLCLAYYYGGEKLKSLGCAYKALQFEPDNERLRDNVKKVIDTMADTDY